MILYRADAIWGPNHGSSEQNLRRVIMSAIAANFLLYVLYLRHITDLWPPSNQFLVSFSILHLSTRSSSSIGINMKTGGRQQPREDMLMKIPPFSVMSNNKCAA